MVKKQCIGYSSKIAEHKAARELIQLIEQKQLKDNNIVKIKEDEEGKYFITKGDNVPIPDPVKVRFKDICGVVVAIIY